MMKPCVCAALILGCATLPVRPAAQKVSGAAALDEALVRTAERIITTALEQEQIPGASIAIVREGRVLLSKGYGVADIATGRPVGADTVFRIGSITKVVTALGIMQLVGTGQLALDDDVNEHLTQMRVVSRFEEPVRVRHLLTHSAGFDQRFMNREGARESDRYSLATFLQSNLFVVRPPGEFASYDTYGITLAGHLQEQLARVPYEVYVRERLFRPMGMSRSSIGMVTGDAARDVAVGYRLANDVRAPQRWEHYRTVPASSANSTASDMARLMVAVLGEGQAAGGQRVWPETVGRQLQQPQHQNGPHGGFAYGFWDDTRDGIRGLFHGGNMNGYESHLYLAPTLEFGFFVAYNREGRPYPRLRDELTSALRRQLRRATAEPAPPPAAAAGRVQPLQVATEEFAGTYADATYCHTCYENESEGGMSAFPVEASGPGRLRFSGATWIAIGPLEFAEENGERHAWFRRSEDGRIAHFAISHRTYEKLTDRLVGNVAAASGIAVEDHPFAPRVYRLTQQHARAADAYGRLVAIRPWDGVLHHYRGATLLAADRTAEAVASLERASAADQWPSPTYYLLATAYARLRNADRTFEALERAAAAGFRDAARLEKDAAFDAVRQDARFRDFVERLKGR